MIERLDHINVRTSRLDAMINWYEGILQLKSGYRPDFGFGGAWLYASDVPLVHLVEVPTEPTSNPKDLKLEHGAFRAHGFDEFVARLKDAGERSEIVKVPSVPIVQVNVWDPDGNHLHIDFDASECGEHGQGA